MKKSKAILILPGILFLIVIGIIFFKYLKQYRNIRKEAPSYIVEPAKLYYDFALYPDSSKAVYINQIIQLTGQVIEFEIEENGASIVFVNPIAGITCSFDSLTLSKDFQRISTVHVGDSITLKGRCDGYDMIMGIVLSECVLQ